MSASGEDVKPSAPPASSEGAKNAKPNAPPASGERTNQYRYQNKPKKQNNSVDRTNTASSSSVLRGVQPTFMNTMDSTLKIILYVAMAVVLIILVSYLYYLLSNTRFKKYTVMKNPIPLNESSHTVAEEKKLPVLSNGIEFTYSLWSYVKNIEPTENTPKMILLQGTQRDRTESGLTSPDVMFMMSSNNNRLYALVRSQAKDDYSTLQYMSSYGNYSGMVLHNSKYQPNNESVTESTTSNGYTIAHTNNSILLQHYLDNPYVKINKDDKHINTNASPGNDSIPCGYHVMQVDYIPLQSWFHVALTVNHSYIILYVDGEIHKTISLEDRPCSTPNGDVIQKPRGNLIAGSFQNMFAPVNGIMSKVQVFNYPVGIDQARALREAGPVSKSLLQYIGLQGYGLQSPIYRKDASFADMN